MKDISMHILDIVGNSVRAGAVLTQILINESETNNKLEVVIEDNGKGMDEESLKRINDPFYTSRSTRKVGMGIPLLQQNTQQTGGDVVISSQPEVGTKLSAYFELNHIDCPPMGDLAGTISLIISGNSAVDFLFKYQWQDRCFELDSREVKVALGEVDIQNFEVIKWMEQMISENLKEIKN